MMDDKPTTLDEASQPGPESNDSDYLAWKERQVRAAIKNAEESPQYVETLEDVAKRMRQKSEQIRVK